MSRKKNLDMLAILQEHDLLEYGHFALGSNMHSHLYIHACKIFKKPNMAQKIAKALLGNFQKRVDVVVAPSKVSYIIAQEVAAHCGGRATFTENNEHGALILKRNLIIKPTEHVLIVDDVSVSGKQIERAVSLIKRTGAKILGVAVIVDRSSGYMPFNVPLRALVSYPLKIYSPAQCPLCKSNIPIIKEDNND